MITVMDMNLFKEIELPVYGNDGKIMLFLNQWPEIEYEFPGCSFFLDKTICGCGATTLFLTDEHPTIICSPRRELMYCKAESGDFPTLHLFKTREQDQKQVSVHKLQEGIKGYYGHSSLSWPVPTYIPKIFVSYDSFPHVAQVLGNDLGKFRVVVDEAQTLFTDAAYRGRQVIEFLENIKCLGYVIYLTATPFDAYMDQEEAFLGLPYLKLKWQKTSIHRTNIKREKYKASIDKTIEGIIERFRGCGHFDEPIYDEHGNELYSREAVFYLNSVNRISAAVLKNKLSPSEVNILCSDQDVNYNKLPKGFDIGRAPQKGEPHKTFTFVTRAAFEGVDFNSTSAYSYIFSEIKEKQSNLAVDISYDLPQIMGRQRNPDNPFRYSATFFHNLAWDFSEEKEKEFMEKIARKVDATNIGLGIYSKHKDNPEEVAVLARKYRHGQDWENYQDDYLDVVDNQVTNKVYVVPNNLAYLNERRAWDIQKGQYLENCSVMRSIDDATQIIQDTVLDSFFKSFTGTFAEKMEKYVNFLSQNPQYKTELDRSTLIPFNYKYYLKAFWPDRLDMLKAVSYKESEIRSLLHIEEHCDEKRNEIIATFKSGEFYTFPDVKEKIQAINDRLEIDETAKANELPRWLECKKQRKTMDDGTRAEGYLIL